MDSTTRRPLPAVPDTRALRPSPDPETAVTSLFAADRSNGDGVRRRRRATGLSATGTLTPMATPPLDVVTTPHASSQRDDVQTSSIAARHALERALRQLPRAPIGVVGVHASPLAEWLRRMGRAAEAITPAATGGQQELASQAARRWPVIVVIDCVEHAPNPAQLLSALRRMLAPDGRVVIVVPNPTHASSRLAILRGQYPLPVPGSAFRHPFTAIEIERLLEGAGFAVMGIERELDSVETLKEIGAGLPDPVLAVLADDTDAMTSYFAILAGPYGPSATKVLYRRVRELENDQHSVARLAEHLARRLSDLEGRTGERPAEAIEPPRPTSASPSIVDAWRRGADRTDAAHMLNAIARLEQDLQRATERLAARDAADATRDEALRQARETLLASVGEVKSLVARIEKSRYRRVVTGVCRFVNRDVPRGSIVAVISRGDPELLAFDRRQGWHFPQTDKRVYAGHHPADSKAAIAHLEHIRSKGARYLLIPRTSFWWLEHYREFNEHLLRRYRCVLRDEHTCMLFALGKGQGR